MPRKEKTPPPILSKIDPPPPSSSPLKIAEVMTAAVQRRVDTWSGKYADDLERAETLAVSTEAEYAAACTFHQSLVQARLALEKERKDTAAPWDTLTKAINTAYRGILSSLQAAADRVSRVSIAWKSEEDRRREKILEEQRERERIAAETAAETGQAIRVKPKEAPPPTPQVVRGTAGSTGTRAEWQITVVDLALVDREFLVFDEQLVKAKCRMLEKTVGAPRRDLFPGLVVEKVESLSSRRAGGA